MNLAFDLSVEISEWYDFNKESLHKIEQNHWVKNQWPIVYFIQNQKKRIAYVGESTNAASRIRNHLANPERTKLNRISIIGSDKFNKSATLDIESKLIQYISAEETFQLQNGNHGLVNHNYYQQDLYRDFFEGIWQKLLDKKIVKKSLKDIENTELFKYSPYKSLNEDQYKSVLEILNGLTKLDGNTIFVRGSAGTGKTVLATYLVKLLRSDISVSNVDDYNDDELTEVNLILKFQQKYPRKKIGLVIAMTSLRETLKNVFKSIPGLNPNMVISPSQAIGINYDLLIVDEAHRLRQYRNIGWLGAFRKNNRKLNLDDSGDELDWILLNSKNQIFFYDAAQSVKPSDVDQSHFNKLLNKKSTQIYELVSQMRVKGGRDYISFIDELINVRRRTTLPFAAEGYELMVFDSIKELYSKLKIKEKQYGLCRLIAGYSWPWLSKNDKKVMDIKIDGLEFQWNNTDKDWINSSSAFNEVGCIHTTQGYDLNYTGVIFGEEISYDPHSKRIIINREKYFDRNGSAGIEDPEELKAYIVNIYKTIMYRGIRGTFIFACDKNLREYFKQNIDSNAVSYSVEQNDRGFMAAEPEPDFN